MRTTNRTTELVVEGARVHNLKNVSVRIPRESFTVITGLSGSGKSSLAFDTIFAEGQRRYVESLSAYARQFFGTLQKPDVDLIEGLTPAISIDQKSAAHTPRSTVGTMSEVYDYLRLLFARVGIPHCPDCDLPLEKQSLAAKPETRPTRKRVKATPLVCPNCQRQFPELSLSLFSFNSPQGACLSCHGLGTRRVLDLDLVMPNPRLTLAEGAIRPWSRLGNQGNVVARILARIKDVGISLDTPIGELAAEQRTVLAYGSQELGFEGILPNLEKRYLETESSYVRSEIERYMVEQVCASCKGQRLRPEALSVRLGNHNIVSLTGSTITVAKTWIQSLESLVAEDKKQIISPIMKDVAARLGYLEQVGLDYLTLDRTADTLAGGEAQRIRLATQLGSGLTGVLYVLDEPSIGLHPQNLDQLIETIKELRDLENTVIVVEHDAQLIRAADYVIDIGPGAGVAGGEVIAQGSIDTVLQSKDSLTAQYLRGDRAIEQRQRRRTPGRGELIVEGATGHNLKDVTATLPLETLICVTGVSGSGKSTLIQDILARALAQKLHRSRVEPEPYRDIRGVERLDKVISVDQSPIGRTPRSNPATYTNVFGPIRDLFAATPLAIERKYGPGHFSFNVREGRCEACRGDGVIQHEMHFLPDVYVECEACRGTRYQPAILDVRYNDVTIADVLSMTIEEANTFFAHVPAVSSKLSVLAAVGLGYLELGQPATTLSGGEAQRIKLATDLARSATGRTLYILDEPTTGLHFEDIRSLLGVLQALVDKGNTVVVIEHNLDVIAASDWVIDLGPAGGDRGGEIVAQGTPEQIAKNPRSVTGKYLKQN